MVLKMITFPLCIIYSLKFYAPKNNLKTVVTIDESIYCITGWGCGTGMHGQSR